MEIDTMDGFVKIYRSLLKWQWYSDHNTLVLFLHLILKANHKAGWHKGTRITRGQLLTGRKILSKETGLSEMSVRTSLKRLISTDEITVESSRKGSVITVKNYSCYQANNQQHNQKVTNDQPTSNQRLTTNKNPKNPKKEKKKTVGCADISPSALRALNEKMGHEMTGEEKAIKMALLTR